MLTRQLSLRPSKRWSFLSLKNLRSCQLTIASTSNMPKLAPGMKRLCANQAAASTAAESGTPASFVLSAARELADAGVSAAGLATYAEKASRYRQKTCFSPSNFALSCGSQVYALLSFQHVCLTCVCVRQDSVSAPLPDTGHFRRQCKPSSRLLAELWCTFG